jgi:hypothetical protein
MTPQQQPSPQDIAESRILLLSCCCPTKTTSTTMSRDTPNAEGLYDICELIPFLHS